LLSAASFAASQPFYSALVDSSSITVGSLPHPSPAWGRVPSLRRNYSASSALRTHPSSVSAVASPHGDVDVECRWSSRRQTSLVAHCSIPCVLSSLPRRQSRIAFLVLFTRDVGLPRYYGESASALAVSRPARCSLALRPARPLIPFTETFS